jgi:hypothetical protein
MKHNGRLLVMIVIVALVATVVFLFGSGDGDLRDSLREFWGVEDNVGIVDDDDDEDDAPSRIELVSGRPVVRLSEEQLRASGIGTEQLASFTLRPEINARGRVVDASPLLALSAAAKAASAERDRAIAALSIAKGTLNQLRQLHAEGGNISARAVSEAEASMLAEQAALQTVEAKIADLRAEAVQRWGLALADAALEDGPLLQGLERRKEAILLVTLPPDRPLPADSQRAFVDRDGRSQAAVEAFLIDQAPAADALMQGETYFYRTATQRLRTGMLVDVRIPIPGQANHGVLVPSSAVIWHAGNPWAFIQREDGGFERHDLSASEETAGGWFVSNDLRAGQMVVVSGGQMLLSEEYRWSIPDEDDVP